MGQWERAPKWALLGIVAGLVALIVLVPIGIKKTRVDPETAAAASAAATPSTSAIGEPTQPIAVFLGDSYTEGTGAENANRSFAAQVALQESWQLINAGQGGTGYVTDGPPQYPARDPLPDRVADVVSQHPQVVIVAAGIDDAERGYSVAQLTAGVQATLQPLRDQLPEAFIAVIGPFWPNEAPTASVDQVDQVVQDVAKKVGLPFVSPIEDKWITGTNDGTPLGNRVQYIGPDGTHPTQAGHDYLASKIEDFLARQPNLPRGG
jgi:lysophospholipase L1-like esterase